MLQQEDDMLSIKTKKPLLRPSITPVAQDDVNGHLRKNARGSSHDRQTGIYRSSEIGKQFNAALSMRETAARRFLRERSASFPTSSSRGPLQITTTNFPRRPTNGAIILHNGGPELSASMLPETKIQKFVADWVPSSPRVVSSRDSNQCVLTSVVASSHSPDDEHEQLISRTADTNMEGLTGQEEYFEPTSEFVNFRDKEVDTAVSPLTPDGGNAEPCDLNNPQVPHRNDGTIKHEMHQKSPDIGIKLEKRPRRTGQSNATPSSISTLSPARGASKGKEPEPTTPMLRTHSTTLRPGSAVDLNSTTTHRNADSEQTQLPLPPFSVPTYLQLELSADRPSPLYIQSPDSVHLPYESSHVKYQRLLNFLLLPPQLEQVLGFGTVTCLDAWLYTFTILPLRFCKAFYILLVGLMYSVFGELRGLAGCVFASTPRFWLRGVEKPQTWTSPKSAQPNSACVRRNKTATSKSSKEVINVSAHNAGTSSAAVTPKLRRNSTTKQRTRNARGVSALKTNHKVDLLQGLLIIATCTILMKFDASRMYHSIRGQAAIKLYVIYNVLEVGDRLFSALGQDILECLFASETLDRKPNGRSKVFRPLWMFALALVYCVIHTTALFYQVITLNVAVNSYSNALLTLLMSNQFVEIKGTVFKKFEKENLFQLTCADVVERFQLWLMLLIIALRNIVEVGGLSITLGSFGPQASTQFPSNASNVTNPTRTFGMLPDSFTVLPSLPFQVLGPFLIVLGSEMIVDWLKHAYISKFNATSPKLYGHFLDVLAKDYYSYSFSAQNLTRRLGLPVIPLACLFIRAALQTYHMFVATNVTTPSSSLPITTTSLSVEAVTTLPWWTKLDHIFRRAMGTSSFGGGAIVDWASAWTLDDIIALVTMIVFFLAIYMLLLAFKLVLGMVLLRLARARYEGIKRRENDRITEPGTKRTGGWGVVELGEDRRKQIYEGDVQGLKSLKDREAKADQKYARGASKGLDNVDRYSMVAKRIW